MKTTAFSFLLCLFGMSLLAQAPQKMSYQAVVRNTDGELVKDHTVGMKVSIFQGSPTGTTVFQEKYNPNPQTNANGLVSIEIGTGIPLTGTFSGIDWSTGVYFLKTETDPAGGTNYTITGTSQLLSVPYALYAKTAANGFSGNYNDLSNKPLLFDGSWTSLTGKPSFATVATSGSYTDLINKPALFDGVWTNITGKPTTLAGYSITDGMSASHVANSITSTMMTNWNSAYGWGNHAGLYKPASYLPTWGEITGIPGGFSDGVDHVDDADNNITNEIQTLSLTGTQLTLSREGGTVTLPSSGGGDNWGSQSVMTDFTLTGNGTTTSLLGIVQSQLQPGWANINGKPTTLAGYGITDGMSTSHDANIITLAMITNWNRAYGWGNHDGLYKSAGYFPSWGEITGIPGGFSDGVDHVDDADSNPTNEIQTLSLSGTLLTISGAGGNTLNLTNWDTNETDDVKLSGNQTIAGNKTFTGTINAGSNTVTNVANPVNDQDAATKAYVDALIGHLSKIGTIVADADGNIYPSVRIGSQIWMAENLKTTKYNDGTAIPLVTDNTAWANLTTPGYCWYDNDHTTYGAVYGALYNWYTVNTGKLCPTGWHAPSDAEWTTLTTFLGGESAAGGKMKETGTTHWISPNTGATNESGFSGLPGGFRYSDGIFYQVRSKGLWWSTTEYSTSSAWDRALTNSGTGVGLGSDYKDVGFSVRCLRDN